MTYNRKRAVNSQRKYRATHRESCRTAQRARYARNPKYFKGYVTRRKRRIYQEIREKLGGKCVICGTRHRKLCAHEIHGRKHTDSVYWILKHLEDFVLVCWRCHTVISTIAKRPKDEQAQIWAFVELINEEKRTFKSDRK